MGSPAEIEALIVGLVAAQLGVATDVVDPDAVITDLGLSSRAALGLMGDLQQRLDQQLSPTLFWEHPTARMLAQRLAGGVPDASPASGTGHAEDQDAPSREPIAVIGVGCRFPGADGPDAYWRLLDSGGDAVGGDAHGHPVLNRTHGLLTDIDQFDAEFFAISGREAAHVDPQQRLLLEVAWEALEHAGIAPPSVAGTRTGVFVGISASDYGRLQGQKPQELGLHAATGQALSIAANRISYVLDTKGPSLAIDTACSSSLVALHMACNSLRDGESTMALAGGVNLVLSSDAADLFAQAGMLSADGRCKTFDASADGYVRSEGCGLVLLKRLSAAVRDGDHVLAVIRGSAVNQDGRSNGLTAPHGGAQQAVIRAALREAGLAPADVDYVEAHGTGTALGDPIEAAALAAVLGDGRAAEEPFALGSVKTNIGHAEAAAGIAGVIKVVLMLRHERIPPHLHLRERNPQIAEGAPFVIPVDGQPWQRRRAPLTAGVSSFGFGGTNAHLILQAGPPAPGERAGRQIRPTHLLTVSARSQTAVAALAGRYAAQLQAEPDTAIGDFCQSVHTGRAHFGYRAAFAVRSHGEALERLTELAAGERDRSVRKVPRGEAGGVAFLFSGQGSQFVDMGRQLYVTNALFRDILIECGEVLQDQLGRSLQSILFPQPGDEELLNETRFTQPALLCLEYALARLWLSWGVRPDYLLGHSVGELSAACVAGVLDLVDGLRLVAERGRIVQELSAPGAMLAVFADESTVRRAIAGRQDRHGLALAAVNGAQNVTVSGEPAGIESLERDLLARGLTVRPVTAGFAFHSSMMAAARSEFAKVAAGIEYHAPRIPLVSDLDGRLFDAENRPDAEYWGRHLEETVRFADGVRLLGELGCTTFVEVGPGQVLIGAGRREVTGARWLPSVRSGVDDWDVLTDSLGHLYTGGHDLNWAGLHEGYRRGRVPLPTYPFERKRHWLSAAADPTPVLREAGDTVEPSSSVVPRQDQILSALGKVVATLLESESPIDPDMSFLELGADSMTLFQTIQTVQSTFSVSIPVGRLFEEVNTLRRLASYIREEAPAGVVAEFERAGQAPAGAPPAVEMPLLPVAGSSVSAESAGAVGRFLDVHARVMDQAYELLRAGRPARGPVPAPALPATQSRRRTAVAAAPKDTFVAFGPKLAGGSRALDDTQRGFVAEVALKFCARTARSKEQAALERPLHADIRHAPQPYPSLKETSYPIAVGRSRGARVWDVDGNEYIDLTMGFGVNLFGHNEPFINDAVAAQLSDGMQLGPTSPLVVEVAELICGLTGKERVAFCNTGSEAVMVAIRLARAITGRSRIALFAGAYHGSADPVLARQDIEGASGESAPMAPGVPPEVSANALVLPYGDESSLAVLREHASELAAVLVEPVQSRRPDLQPVEFLRQVREITRDSGAALVFDEVITGFRTHPGGVQALFDITADLAVYGKVIGGGMPLGVVAGDARYLDAIDGGAWEFGDRPYPHSVRTFFSGTFCKHPLTLAASRAVLRELRDRGPALQEDLNARVAGLAGRLNVVFARANVPIRVGHFGSLFRLRFLNEPQRSELVELFHVHLIHSGLYIWEGRNLFLSTAHTDQDVDQIVDTIVATVDAMVDVGFFPGSRTSLAARPV